MIRHNDFLFSFLNARLKDEAITSVLTVLAHSSLAQLSLEKPFLPGSQILLEQYWLQFLRVVAPSAVAVPVESILPAHRLTTLPHYLKPFQNWRLVSWFRVFVSTDNSRLNDIPGHDLVAVLVPVEASGGAVRSNQR